jgi:thiol-disulfide isomerase/thioredoxin
MKAFIQNQWHKYRRKKTSAGIILDFLFFALLIAMLIPDSRKVVSSTVIRYTMFQPRESRDVVYVDANKLKWHLTDMNGQQASPHQSLGKPIFINFWATWCPPCIAELPSIQKLYDQYKDQVDFYLITQEDENTINEFLERRDYQLPIYRLHGHVSDLFYSRKIPASFLISPEGKLVMKKHGAANWDGSKVLKIIDKMLAE